MCTYSEPSPEEKLQKLHTDIKFALKVDNPVSDIYEFDSFCFFVTAWKLYFYYLFVMYF